MSASTRTPPYPRGEFLPKKHHETYEFISTANSSTQKGRHVVITGASKGIGRELAISFARAGASGIAILARSTLSGTTSAALAAAKESGHPTPKILEIACDITDEKSVGEAADKAKTEFEGKLDLVVNNAGYLEKWKPLAETDPEDWWKSWTVNIKGSYLIDRAFIPILLAYDGQKTLITLSSIGAWNTRAGGSAYQGTKTALVRLNMHIAAEYSEKGLLVYSIHPGGIMTELATNMPKETHHILVDKVELPADTTVWLTNERREWLNNRFVDVCWDMEDLLARKGEIDRDELLKLELRI